MHMSWQPAFGALALVGVLAGCTGDRLSAGLSPTGSTAPAVARNATPPPVDMAGRWSFSGGSGGQCAMNFGAPAGSEGAIRPEGGCPGNFFTSRKWTFESNALIIRDHNSKQLGQLTQVGPGRFEGQSANGLSVALMR